MKWKYSQEEIDALICGKIYINADDLNIFVRRSKGLYSWTLNLGNKWSWLIMFLEVMIIWGVVLLINA